MKRNLRISFFITLLSAALAFAFVVGFAQDTGGEDMSGDMSGGMMSGGMSGGMSDAMNELDAEIDAAMESLMSGGSTSSGDMSDIDTSSMTIAEVVAANPDFGILAQLVQAAGLLETLDGEGPFTVFAPNDSAFTSFDNNEVVSLLGDTDALTSVLTYHVVSGELTSEDLAEMSSVTSLQGGDLTIGESMMSDMSGGMMSGGMMSGGMMDDMGLDESMSRMSGGSMSGGMMDMSGGMSEGTGLSVGGANVVSADIVTSNGVIHVIDSVLIPSN